MTNPQKPEDGWHYTLTNANGETISEPSEVGRILLSQGQRDMAKQVFKAGFERGDLECAYALGSILRNDGDPDAAREYLEMGVERGHAQCMHVLAQIELSESNREVGLALLREASHLGDINAAYNLGLLLAQAGEIEEGLKWLVFAAERGQSQAQGILQQFKN